MDQVQWLTPVIPATQEVEMGRDHGSRQANPTHAKKKNSGTPSEQISHL
jgi:hypothetical protein